MLAEDSSTCRALLTAVLESDSQLRIVGQAHDGEAALNLTEQLRPDVVVMDAHMPVMDGFAATRNIMLRCPTPIVIVSASMNVAHVAASMRALAAGALTLLPKPVSPSAPGFDELAQQFVRTVRAMADVKVVRRFHHAPPTTPIAPLITPVLPHADARPRPRVVGIGASTGGPAALQRVLTDMPSQVPVPIVVVQHIARGFVDGLAGWLDAVTPHKVRVATHGELIQAGSVYLAPDDQQLWITRRGTVDLSRRTAVGGFLPSVNVLFSSLGESYGASALGVIMTGMGQDGIEGLRDLRA
ncbi:MAG TPA: chemotaxis protein CheB, partial [Polyangiales bacterium]|nr:chemotaxis protein CheB [Polyangiales bacterium]